MVGTPTISQVINVMKEKEIDTLLVPWANARVAYLLLVCRMTAMEVDDGIGEESSSDNYDHVMFTKISFHCGAGESGKGLYWRMY